MPSKYCTDVSNTVLFGGTERRQHCHLGQGEVWPKIALERGFSASIGPRLPSLPIYSRITFRSSLFSILVESSRVAYGP